MSIEKDAQDINIHISVVPKRELLAGNRCTFDNVHRTRCFSLAETRLITGVFLNGGRNISEE